MDKKRATNTGVLLSSGFIAGEALMAVLLALLYGIISFGNLDFGLRDYGMENPSSLLGVLVFAGLIYLLVKVPMKTAGRSK